ncbi:MAG: hypothetical protein OEW67_07755 [Cyclobacteriaceae bacterium]|nr:hypothetical protein [Cyclobacteriaceae bacterium]
MNKYLILFVFCFSEPSITKLISQPVHKNWLNFNSLEYVDVLPKYISQTKSIAVLIEKNQTDALAMAEKFHPTFIKSGIDPVNYYLVDDLFANKFISEKLSEEFIKREIKYIIILNHTKQGYELIITPFSKTSSFIEPREKAWRMQNPKPEVITRSLYAQAYALERQNLLVVDKPEFRSPIYTLIGQRLEAYKPDLRSETLYIPLFEKKVLDSTQQHSQKLIQIVNLFNHDVDRKNAELRNIFSNYPHPHEFINENMPAETMLKNNVRYVLEMIHTTNQNIRAILNYKEKVLGVTEYVTVTMKNGQGNIKRIPSSATTFKYYIKHLPSNSYYLGTKWDADYTWQEALQNHIGLLIAEIK